MPDLEPPPAPERTSLTDAIRRAISIDGLTPAQQFELERAALAEMIVGGHLVSAAVAVRGLPGRYVIGLGSYGHAICLHWEGPDHPFDEQGAERLHREVSRFGIRNRPLVIHCTHTAFQSDSYRFVQFDLRDYDREPPLGVKVRAALTLAEPDERAAWLKALHDEGTVPSEVPAAGYLEDLVAPMKRGDRRALARRILIAMLKEHRRSL